MNLHISNPDEIKKNKETTLIQLFKIYFVIFTKSFYDLICNIISYLIEYSMAILIYACSHNNTKLAKILIDKGAKLDLQNNNGRTALTWSALTWSVCNNNTKLAKILIDKGANLDLQNNNGRSALIWSVRNNNTKLAKILIDKGANLELQDKKRHTALMWACHYNYTEIVSYILEFI